MYTHLTWHSAVLLPLRETLDRCCRVMLLLLTLSFSRLHDELKDAYQVEELIHKQKFSYEPASSGGDVAAAV